MTIVDTGPYTLPYLVYDAPINEGTKQIREKFKVDEKTGYPEYYNWRSMAKLGPVYSQAEPFKLFSRYKPEEYYSTQIFYVFGGAVIATMLGVGLNYYEKRPVFAKPHRFLAAWAIFGGSLLYYHEKTLQRQGVLNKYAIDYIEQHPDRFDPVYRPKLREVLYHYLPNR